MNLSNVSPQDWVALALGIIGMSSAYLKSKSQLPSWARSWLTKIGPDTITKAIEIAAIAKTQTPQERQASAVAYLQRVVKADLGLSVPTSIANLLVEFVYQTYKAKTSR